LETALTILYLIIAIGLIVAILFQTGDESGLSGAITGSAQTLGGKKKGKDELLGKATIYLAAIFMVFSIIITIFHA